MSKEWIESLADELKQKGREAAETYAREQHRAGIIAAEGKVFFTALVLNLEQDFAAIRAQLQGSAVSAETSLTRDSPTQVRLNRSRFPWFDATLKHNEAEMVLEYAQGKGVPGEQTLSTSADAHVVSFSFRVDPQDKLSVAVSFADEASGGFDRPEELARHILELLFKA